MRGITKCIHGYQPLTHEIKIILRLSPYFSKCKDTFVHIVSVYQPVAMTYEKGGGKILYSLSGILKYLWLVVHVKGFFSKLITVYVI